jgi:hypothetical protein
MPNPPAACRVSSQRAIEVTDTHTQNKVAIVRHARRLSVELTAAEAGIDVRDCGITRRF